MTDPITKISDKAQLATEHYGIWPETTIDGLKAIRELNSVTKALLRSKVSKCLQ